MERTLSSQRISYESEDELQDSLYARSWTDGLPVVPPTPARVAAFLEVTSRRGDEVVGIYPTRSRVVTLEKLAINAVMAGCKPEYFPVVIAIIEAMLDDDFHMHTANASTGGLAISFIVNGPIVGDLDMNFRGNVLGPGNRATATIGRAIRLIQTNVFGSRGGAGNETAPGTDTDSNAGAAEILDRSTFGTPAKYACYHFVENEVDFPDFEPLHVERGLRPEDSAVTVFAAGGHMHLSMNAEETCDDWVSNFAHHVIGMGRLQPDGECLVAVPPDTVELMRREGWSKGDLRAALYRATRRSLAWVKSNGWKVGGRFRAYEPVTPEDETSYVAIAGSADQINVVLCGGPGSAFGWYQYSYASSFGPVTKVVRS